MSAPIILRPKEVAALAGFTALYFSAAVAVFMGILFCGFAILGVSSWGGGEGKYLGASLGFALIFFLIVLILVLAVAVTITAFSSLVAAPLAGLLGLALRRIRVWPIHLAAYFAGGALVAIPVALYVAYPVLNGVNIQTSPSLAPLFLVMFLAGASTAAGWATAWRISNSRPDGGENESFTQPDIARSSIPELNCRAVAHVTVDDRCEDTRRSSLFDKRETRERARTRS